MDKHSRIYVAGHRGLVGSAIHRALRNRGFDTLITRTSTELDLRDQGAVETFFASEKPDIVILAAARVGGILANSTYKAQFIYDNLLIAANVIDAAYRHKARKLLNLGSSCIYPKLAPQPLKEEFLLTGPLEQTNEPYAIAKIAAIKLCRYYNEQYGTDFLSLMPTNMYGPNDNFNLETAHVLPTLLRKFHLAKLLHEGNIPAIVEDLRRFPVGFGITTGELQADQDSVVSILAKLGITDRSLTLWGTGSPFREFLHADDFADCCVTVMTKHTARETGELLNVGTGSDLRISELASLIKTITGYEGEILYDSSRPDGTPRKILDVSRLSALGWKATISLEEGIRNTYSWYLQSLASGTPR